jgi:hypothetical protein
MAGSSAANEAKTWLKAQRFRKPEVGSQRTENRTEGKALKGGASVICSLSSLL